MTTPKAKVNKISLLRKVYNWTLKQCETPYADWFLGCFSFLESIIVPLPTDPLYLIRAAAAPKKAFWIALYVALASVLGGTVGYFLGAYFWDSLSPFIFKYVFSEETFSILKGKFSDNTFLFMVLGGFSPLPFKAFTLTAGSMSLPLTPFLTGALVGRGLRFLTLGALVYFFGAEIRDFITKHLERAVAILTVLGVALLAYKML